MCGHMSPLPDHRDKSFWLAHYGPYAPNPSVQGDLTVDVAIVGGGFTGLWTALLAKEQEMVDKKWAEILMLCGETQ